MSPESMRIAANLPKEKMNNSSAIKVFSIGDAVVDEMQYINIPNVEGAFLTEPVKENILNYLKFMMEKKQLGILGDDARLIAQLNEQQYEYLKPKTAQERIHLKFWHPQGRHDDQLFALAFACHASRGSFKGPRDAFVFY